MQLKLNQSELKLLSDIELIAHYKLSSDNACVGILYERYTVLVFGVCMKYLKDEDESKDAVMHIFEKLLLDLTKHEVTNFKSWLFSVARNHCLMAIRKEKGIYVIGFYYPVVAKGQARIRVQISAAHTTEHLDHAIQAFVEVGKELGVIK